MALVYTNRLGYYGDYPPSMQNAAYHPLDSLVQLGNQGTFILPSHFSQNLKSFKEAIQSVEG